MRWNLAHLALALFLFQQLDAIFLPTPAAVVTEMLRMAHVGPGDVVFDLGSGDGRIPIAAVKASASISTRRGRSKRVRTRGEPASRSASPSSPRACTTRTSVPRRS
jgi:hypothetical protein